MAAFTFKSPEPGVPTPFPGSEPERGKQRVFVQADRSEAPHFHLQAPFLLSPKASPTAFPRPPRSSSWWAGGKISLETPCQPPVALEEVTSQEKQASGFHGAVNKQSIPEAEGREGSRMASFPPSPSLSRPINFSSRRWALRACQPRSPPPLPPAAPSLPLFSLLPCKSVPGPPPPELHTAACLLHTRGGFPRKSHTSSVGSFLTCKASRKI